MNNDKTYLISAENYYKHIEDKVHLYSLLHQLKLRASKAGTPDEIKLVATMAINFGEAAEGLFGKWNIPAEYVLTGDTSCLKTLEDSEVLAVIDLDAADDFSGEFGAEDFDDDDTWDIPGLHPESEKPDKSPIEDAYKSYLTSTASLCGKTIAENIKATTSGYNKQLECFYRVEALFEQNECIDAYESLNGLFKPIGLELMPELPDFKGDDDLYDLFFSELMSTLKLGIPA